MVIQLDLEQDQPINGQPINDQFRPACSKTQLSP